MDIFNIASALFGSSRIEESGGLSNTVDSVSAVGATASVDGSVGITMDADVTPADDVDGEDIDQTIIDVPTSPAVDVEDDLILGLTGDGPLKVPVVLANPGSGDRMQAAVTEAYDLASSVEDIAQQAIDVANATGQHFWPADDGVHVTEVTQDEWNDSTGSSYHSGANVLLNALGQLFRNGLNNLLALVGGTDPCVAIYDGQGNDAENITASFTGSGVTIGSEYTQDYHDVIDSNGLSIWTKRAADLTKLLIMRFNRDGIAFAEERTHTLSLYNVLHEIVANAAGLHLYAYGDQVENSPVARIDLNATAGTTSGNGSITFTLGNTSGAHTVTVPNATGTLALDTVTTATLTRGAGASSWAVGEVKKYGHVVSVCINDLALTSQLAAGATSGTITTIPAGYRPPRTARFNVPIAYKGSWANVWMAIGTGGNVVIVNDSDYAIPAGRLFSFTHTYIVA